MKHSKRWLQSKEPASQSFLQTKRPFKMYADCGPAAGCFFRKVEIGDHHFKVIYDDNDQEDFTMYIYVGW
jgi:hypothetical protein